MLGEVNLLYLGCQVLVLLDLSYLSRFWVRCCPQRHVGHTHWMLTAWRSPPYASRSQTMYEGWLSQQQPTAQGLKLAQAQHATRCTIVPILGASEAYKMALTGTFSEKMASPELAAAYLQNDDVSVTNTSDKEKQLAKLHGLDDRVRAVLARDALMPKVQAAMHAEPMDATALRKAVDAAKAGGVGDAALEDASRILKAVSGQSKVSQDKVSRALNLLLKEELEEQRGLMLVAMHKAGVPATFARAAGYNLIELKAAGYVEGLKAVAIPVWR